MNQNLVTQLKTVQDEITALKNAIKGHKPPGCEHALPDLNRYCWTHGYHVCISHSSKTCKMKVVGHQDEATRANNIGGSQNGKWQGQSMVMTTSDKFTNYSNASWLQISPHPPDQHPAFMDTGTTGHFLLCNATCLNLHPTTSPIHCQLPDGNHMILTHEAELDIPQCTLPIDALTTHLFPELAAYSLISIGTFCDHGCHALFTSHNVHIIIDGTTNLQGSCNPNGLWLMDLHNPAWWHASSSLPHSTPQHQCLIYYSWAHVIPPFCLFQPSSFNLDQSN